MTDDKDTETSSISIIKRFYRWIEGSYSRKILLSLIILIISIVINLTVLVPLGQNRFLFILISMIFYVYLLTPRDSTILTIITAILFTIYHELISAVFPLNLISPIIPIAVFSILAYMQSTSINRRRKLEQRIEPEYQ